MRPVVPGNAVVVPGNAVVVPCNAVVVSGRRWAGSAAVRRGQLSAVARPEVCRSRRGRSHVAA